MFRLGSFIYSFLTCQYATSLVSTSVDLYSSIIKTQFFFLCRMSPQYAAMSEEIARSSLRSEAVLVVFGQRCSKVVRDQQLGIISEVRSAMFTLILELVRSIRAH
ncbi:hypothetical protein EVAR_93959_1 [Eumeta japonica]|uniref:Uncharacterized protein n=1 Tax=Eumeta variegata TaxID=151549 RepID=A0A4C1TP83_EUMVA|nr:hypothetical protein EVAR_93959_1 [Eumeta japonica]